ncbi:MAG: hypothetical protein KA124_15415, partial [Luteimonas sp.]|nr:hypothetical protein [Luteimonas sp.]
MPETHTGRRQAALAGGLGIVLAALAGFGGAAAVLAAWLAQPALALAVRAWRDGRPLAREALTRDARALLALWGGGLLLAGLLVAWPLLAVLQSNGLGAALAL